MFKLEMTDEFIKIQGKTSEVLTGLVVYIKTLKKHKISDEEIKQAIELAFLDNDKMKAQKFDLNNMSKEEALKVITKELFDMLG